MTDRDQQVVDLKNHLKSILDELTDEEILEISQHISVHLKGWFQGRQQVMCSLQNNAEIVLLANTVKCKVCDNRYFCKKHKLKRCPYCNSVL